MEERGKRGREGWMEEERGKKGGLTALHPRRSGNRSIYRGYSSLGCWCCLLVSVQLFGGEVR